MRKLTAWLLALALTLGCAPGLAQSREETCATVFETEAPSLLLPALEALGYAPGDVRCGALWEYTPCVYALIALERDGVRTLAGAVLDLDGVWRTENLGEKMLLPGRDFRIVFHNPVAARPDIYVEYAPLNGVTERYGFSYEWFYSDVLWRVDSYQREEADGSGYAITRYPYEGFCMRALDEPDDPSSGKSLPACWTGFCAYIDGAASFPTTWEQALALAESSMRPYTGGDWVLLYGTVNLREQPTGRSKSLGRYHGALARRLDETPGRDAPWVHVSVGGVEGYVSGVYAVPAGTGEFLQKTLQCPIPWAHADAPTSLCASPGGPAAAQLAQGAMMYVMGETDTGWLHVTLPSDGVMRSQMDLDGQSGYVRARDVTVGSAATLNKDAQ